MHLPLPAVRDALALSTALAADAVWLGVRLAGYPLGVRAPRQTGYHPVQSGPRAWNEVPVVLVHGMVDNRSAYSVLEKSLRRRGFVHISGLSYPIRTRDVPAAAHLLAEHVEAVCARTGADRVHVVGHSLGGIVARWYVQRMGGEARVDTVVALGSPHAGTRAAHLLPLPLVRQLRPGSPVRAALAAPMPGCRTRVVSIWSTDDELMLPRTSARLEHPDLDVADVRVTGVGHLALLAHPAAVAAVAGALRSPLVTGQRPGAPAAELALAQ